MIEVESSVYLPRQEQPIYVVRHTYTIISLIILVSFGLLDWLTHRSKERKLGGRPKLKMSKNVAKMLLGYHQERYEFYDHYKKFCENKEIKVPYSNLRTFEVRGYPNIPAR